MLYYIKLLMMLLLIWHVFIFYMGIYVHPNNNNYCTCRSNPITIYMFKKYFKKLLIKDSSRK